MTLFATQNSKTNAHLKAVCPLGYEESKTIRKAARVWECLHIAQCFEQAHEFDLIHNQFDYVPLSYTRLVSTPVVTTIHGFSSPQIIPVYQKYNATNYYISISYADRCPSLDYCATIYHGIDVSQFTFQAQVGNYLIFFGRIHPEKGTDKAITIAKQCGKPLVIAGIIHDENYFKTQVKPHIDGKQVIYVGSVGPQKRNQLLSHAYALLHPISFEEPFGLSVVEAMACGTPVVAFNRGSMPEIIKDGKTGFLVTTCQGAVEAVFAIPIINRRFCRKWVENRFSHHRMVDDYLAVYQTVLAQPARYI